MSDDTPVVVCWAVRDLPVPKAGAYKTECAWCQEPIWLYPTSEWVLRAGGVAICMGCGAEAVLKKEALIKGWARDRGAQAN